MSDVVICKDNIWESVSYINLCSICDIKNKCDIYVERKKVTECNNFKECGMEQLG